MAVSHTSGAAGQAEQGTPPIVFVLDCDNTLLDNDRLKEDLDAGLHQILDEDLVERFWQVYEEVRADRGTVDFPTTLERFRAHCPDPSLQERLRALVMDYPFAERLYPATLETVAYLRRIGLPVIVSDGDQIYQWLKIERSGLAEAVEGHVAVYVHKEEHLEEIMERWPASFYVMVDDKARILSETKARFPERFVTVHVRQGHYGTEDLRYTLAPDISLAGIADLRAVTVDELRRHLGRGRAASSAG
ncbi:MAG: HAD family hydrolase [Ktedonobacterales bacterium]